MGSIKLFTLFGTEIKLHWSWFFLFLLFGDFSLNGLLIGALLTVVVFVSVIVHEFGHILTAKRYGVVCNTVTLSILGGTAHVEEEDIESLTPKQSLWVVFAGPLTNIVMGLIYFALFARTDHMFPDDVGNIMTLPIGLLIIVVGLVMNVAMFVFNMIPIFPMDGGRILRSLLQLFKVKNYKMISIWSSIVLSVALLIFSIVAWGAITAPIIAVIMLLHNIVELMDIRLRANADELAQRMTILYGKEYEVIKNNHGYEVRERYN